MSTQVTPNTLNTKWAIAVRLACTLAPRATRLAVPVVPMFSPITKAMPRYMGSTPVEQSKMVMAITAADDCTMSVMIVPIIKKMIMEK